MKQFIVLGAMIALGVFIYNLIMGEQEDSMINMMCDLWQRSIAVRTYSGDM